MRNGQLHGVRILVVEDEAIIALDLCDLLAKAGAEIVGPARTLPAACALAEERPLCAAIRIGGDTVFAVAERLAERGIPFAFHTADPDRESIAAVWLSAEIITKPSASALIVETIARLVASSPRLTRIA